MQKKYPLAILSILLILIIFVSSASAADSNETDVMSIDESANQENNLLSIDNNVESNEFDNNTLKVSNDEVLTDGNNSWYVNGSMDSSGYGKTKETAFKTLTEAISASSDNDIIMIASGEYKGTENINLEINKLLNFKKYGDSEAIFDAQKLSRIWTVNALSINITGLTFKNGKSDNGGAIYFENDISNSNINASFINNTATWEGGANYFKGEVSNSNITGTYTNNTVIQYDGGANFFCARVFGSNVSGIYAYNNATRYGGANIFWGIVSFSNVGGIYTYNKVTKDGGANCFRHGVSFSNVTGTYTKNSATAGGANFFWAGVFGSNVGGTYTGNNATAGGANFFHGRVSLSNVTGTYTSNKANGPDGDNGGGANIFINNVINSTICGTYANNTAENGGANFFLSNVSGSNVTGIYINNNATNGGANYFNASVSASNIAGTYINNTAQNAVIHFQGNFGQGLSANITNSIFLNNKCGYEIYANVESDIKVNDCWFGNNASNFKDKLYKINNVQMGNWLFLNATADYTSLLVMDSSNITFKLNSTDGTRVFEFDNSKLPAVNLTLTATNGDVDKTTTLNQAVKYVATERGKGSVTAKIENAAYTICFDNLLRMDLSVIAKNITYLENETLTLTYNNTATGKVNITLKSKNYNKTIESDINQTITIANLPAGEYNVTVEYSGDNVFSNATSYANFTVEKITTEVIPGKETIELFVDDEYNITYTLKPNYAVGNITFSSNNSNIVTVDPVSGNIIAKAEGSATITVSFSGNENYTASNATITVNVKRIPTQITVNSSFIVVKANDEADMGAGLEPVNAGNLTYKSSDDDIVKVENGKIKGLKCGNVTITISFEGNNKYLAAENKTINVTVELNDARVTVNNATLDLLVGDTFTIVANTVPMGLNVTYVQDDSGVYTVDKNGVVTALKNGTGSVLVKIMGDGVYFENSTIINVTVTKVPTEIKVTNATLDLKVDGEIETGATLTPADAGNLTYTVSNPSIVKVDGGKIIALAEGEAIITVSFAGDNKYAAAENKTINVTVSAKPISPKENLTISASAEPITVGDNATVVVSGLENATGNVSVRAGNGVYFASIENGVATVIIPGLKENTVGQVSYSGDDNYNSASTMVNIIVNPVPEPTKKNLTISASAEPISVGDNATVVVSGLENASGDVSVVVNGETYVSSIKDGEASVTVPGLTENVTAIVNYAGDDNYNSASTTVNIIVNPKEKENATIDIDVPPVTEGQNTTINVKLPEDATGNVTATVNNKSYSVPVKDGKATITIPELIAGNYTIPVTYSGDDKYNSETKDVNVTVDEDKSIIVSVPDITKYFHGSERFVVTVTDNKGKPLANKSVTMLLNGVIYNRITKEDGTVSIGLNLDGGIYNATTTVDNITVISTVTIKSTVNGTDLVKVFRNATQFYATFLDSQGNYLTKGTVISFNINGVFYNRTVGEKGLAKLNINLEQGNYIITSMNTVTGENAANNITVIPRIIENRDLTKYYRNASQYTVKVIGDDGKAVGAGETVRLNINGVIYERQTGANGVAKLNINLQPGDYIITAEYKNCRVSNNIKVLPVLNAKDITMKYRDGTQFKATLIDGQGKPYAGQTVTFNINGVFYNRATDSSGTAKLNINLMPGEYIITSSYNGASIANKITIKG